jgi:PTH2 family peptidyl-tRNA hydrolase
MGYNTKQVLVIRKDLKMRRGKEISQGGHGFLAHLTKVLLDYLDQEYIPVKELVKTLAQKEWLQSSFAKITCVVESEEELISIYNKAKELNIEAHLIVDNGATEFHGEKTATCVCLGPDYSEKIDQVTGFLKLY